MSGEPSVSMLVVRGLLQAARVELLPPIDTGDTRVSVPELFRLIDLVLERSHDPALGLCWIERLLEHSFGPVAHMAVYASTLRQGVSLLEQFSSLIYEGIEVYELLEGERTFTVRVVARGPTERTTRFIAESALAGFFKLVRVYVANARPTRVRLAHAAPAHAPEYERLFGPVIDFDQPYTELEIARGLLDVPSPHADAGMFAAQRTIAERRLLQTTHNAPYAVRVRELLIERFPSRIHMAAVAQALGLSERSLRSELASEGTSYREVEYAALAAMARELLQDPQHTIQETAYKMGFSDATTFHRAVKRWTGLTPSALRRKIADRHARPGRL